MSILTGFDVEIERALARIMRVEISLPPMPWEEHLAALADGKADIASGATASEERSAFAYVSKPYRTETDVLILPKGAGRRYPFRTIEQMLDTFAKQRFRLGVIAGYAYADALFQSGRFMKYVQSHAGLGTRLIELFDAIGLAAFIVVGVVVALDTSAQPLWLWGPIAAVIIASFGGLMRDLYRHDRVTANLGGELYPEIAAVCGLALAVFWAGRANDCSRTRSRSA